MQHASSSVKQSAIEDARLEERHVDVRTDDRVLAILDHARKRRSGIGIAARVDIPNGSARLRPKSIIHTRTPLQSRRTDARIGLGHHAAPVVDSRKRERPRIRFKQGDNRDSADAARCRHRAAPPGTRLVVPCFWRSCHTFGADTFGAVFQIGIQTRGDDRPLFVRNAKRHGRSSADIVQLDKHESLAVATAHGFEVYSHRDVEATRARSTPGAPCPSRSARAPCPRVWAIRCRSRGRST